MSAFTQDDVTQLENIARDVPAPIASYLRELAGKMRSFVLRGAVLGERAPLTKRQFEIYKYVFDYSARAGFAPSFEEIAEQFNYESLATVHEHLSNLERKGYVRRLYNEARGITCLVHIDEVAPTPSAPAVEVRE